MFVARSMPSIVLCPVPYRLSNMCFVDASLTATTGNLSTPSRSMLLSRMTPVVVSSELPVTPSISFFLRAGARRITQSFTFGWSASYRSRAIMWRAPTRSAPSSIVRLGANARAFTMCV